MEWGTDLPANKQRRLAIFINISFCGGNFHETCIIELRPPNRKKQQTTTLIEQRVLRSFSSQQLERHTTIGISISLGYHIMTYQITHCEKSPALFFPAGVSNRMTWIRWSLCVSVYGYWIYNALLYSNMQNTFMFAFSYANCDQHWALDFDEIGWQEYPLSERDRRPRTEWKIREIKQNWYFVCMFVVCLLLMRNEKKDAEEMSFTRYKLRKSEKGKKSQNIRMREKKKKQGISTRTTCRARQAKRAHTYHIIPFSLHINKSILCI